MVAITVILAAVIGTFVLGLGDSLGDNQPTAQLAADIDYEDGNITIEHNGGDSINSDELRVAVSFNGTTYDSEGTYTNRLSVGNEFTANINESNTSSDNDLTAGEDIRIRVIHESSDSILLDRTIEATGDIENVEDEFPLST